MDGEISEQNKHITAVVRHVLVEQLDAVGASRVRDVFDAIDAAVDLLTIGRTGIRGEVEQDYHEGTRSVDVVLTLYKEYRARGRTFTVVLSEARIPEQQRDRDTIIEDVTSAVTRAVDLVEFLDLALVERGAGGFHASP